MNLGAVSGSGPDGEVGPLQHTPVAWLHRVWPDTVNRLETSEESKCLSNFEEVFTEGTVGKKIKHQLSNNNS